MREFTARSLILGLVLAVVFGVANAYLALRMGMTVSASIPAAVMAVALFRAFKGSILEANMVQTIASAGESLAAGIAFTIPAFFILGLKPSAALTVLLILTGGVAGVLALSVVRAHLIETEKLPFPEGTACAAVLKTKERKGVAAMAWAGLVGFAHHRLSSLNLFSGKPGVATGWSYLSADLSPAVVGAGFILGPRLSGLVLSGGALGWLVMVPLISLLKGVPIASPGDADAIWSDYLRYIGAGAVLLGGLVGLVKALKHVVRGVVASLSRPTGRDLSIRLVMVGFAGVFLMLWLTPSVGIGPVGAGLAVVLSFVFAVVSARVVGVVGSSSNPVSGMTIAAVVISALILKITGTGGVVPALGLAAVVCIAAAIAGDTSQDLKTGFLVGAMPKKQQLGELMGVAVSGLAVAWAIFLFNSAYGFDTGALRAPQANIMAIITKGVFESTVPWGLLGIGAAAAGAVELMGIGSLPFAVGLYLPLDISAGLFVGGVLQRLFKTKSVLSASGLIAGDAFAGLLVAGLAVAGMGLPQLHVSHWFGTLPAFLVLVLVLFAFRRR